jgi:hypothetical protein
MKQRNGVAYFMMRKKDESSSSRTADRLMSECKQIFGDFQTPVELTREVMDFVKSEEPDVSSVVEPTCGAGSFLQTSLELFGTQVKYFGFDINPDYVEQARHSIARTNGASVEIRCEDFYTKDWRSFFSHLSTRILVIGNPPWVTNAALGLIGGSNLPEKSNFQRYRGFAAKTGKANFDISEWMLIKLLEALQGVPSSIAMLCKTSTARKVLRHAWLNDLEVGPSSIHIIDAGGHFGVSVDACLFRAHTGNGKVEATATVYPHISFKQPLRTLGLFAGDLVSDTDAYQQLRKIDGIEYRKWRSGVKHDAARVMEFTRQDEFYVNGLKEACHLESDCVYPLLKSSDLANGRLTPSRFVLLTQQRVKDDTEHLRESAPTTWDYLVDHAEYLDERRSSIYSKRPRFSVFGIGEYTFAPWKVAISGLYKNLRFQVIGFYEDKPIVVDDTCYFIPCESEEEAVFFADLFNSEIAQRFISSLVFTDAKRPVTIDVLKRVDLKKLAEHFGKEELAACYLSSQVFESSHQRLLVFEKVDEYLPKDTEKSSQTKGRTKISP